MRTDAIFIGIEVADHATHDPALAAKLQETCPVDIYTDTNGHVELVERQHRRMHPLRHVHRRRPARDRRHPPALRHRGGAGVSAVTPRPERLGIVGSGTIACGLAACAARHGDGDAVGAIRRVGRAGRALRGEGLLEVRGPLPPDRVRITTDLSEGLEDRTFVVEAIAEHMDAKVELFARLRERLDDRALLGTTTSSLPVCTLADASGRPERFVGFHVFNPVARMELIELAFPPQAEPETRMRAHALAAVLEKRAVEVPDARASSSTACCSRSSSTRSASPRRTTWRPPTSTRA